MARKLNVETIHEAVEKSDPDKCWHWPHSLNSHGYGAVRAGGKMAEVHRISYEHYVGPIPTGMYIDHECGTRSCFNPDHLRLASNKENVQHRTKLNTNSTSGFRGVSFHKRVGKYQACVGHNGKLLYLGYFDTAEEAGAVALAKRQELGFLTGFNDTPNSTPDCK